jgi:hypothetical protein
MLEALRGGFLPAATLAALNASIEEAQRQGQDGAVAARRRAWGLHPAWPASLISEAVDLALGRL